jgi:hypothetical protein
MATAESRRPPTCWASSSHPHLLPSSPLKSDASRCIPTCFGVMHETRLKHPTSSKQRFFVSNIPEGARSLHRGCICVIRCTLGQFHLHAALCCWCTPTAPAVQCKFITFRNRNMLLWLQEAAKETVAQCRIGALFDDSKFLSTAALRDLVSAVAAAASPRGTTEGSRRDSDGKDPYSYYSGGPHDGFGGGPLLRPCSQAGRWYGGVRTVMLWLCVVRFNAGIDSCI